MPLRLLLAPLAAAALVAGAAACGGPDQPVEVGPGRPDRGRQAIEDYGCGACHVIPGIRGADSHVGPPLTAFSRRGYIAGRLPNSPEDLVRWIRDPQSVDPETAMPDLGVSTAEAEDIAAYLFTLR